MFIAVTKGPSQWLLELARGPKTSQANDVNDGYLKGVDRLFPRRPTVLFGEWFI